MTFGKALEELKKGEKLSRAGWNGVGQYIELATQINYLTKAGENRFVSHQDIGNQCIVFCGTRGRQMGWLASQADMLADDWTIVEFFEKVE